MRWVIGDVQGCARALRALLRAIDFNAGRDDVIFAGDVVRRGPQSLDALRIVQETGGQGVVGNHDVAIVSRYRGYRDKSDVVVDELRRAPDAEALVSMLERWPVLRRLDDKNGADAAFVVHAGVLPQWTNLDDVATRVNARPRDRVFFTDDPDVKACTTLRFCTASGELSNEKGTPPGPPPFSAWDDHYRGPTRIVHGHWAQRGHYRGPHSIGIDAGCVYGGRLMAWNQEEDRIVSVPGPDG